MRAVGPSDARLLLEAGVETVWGEPGFSAYELTTVRPALTIERVVAGSPGKAVVPATAFARISVRLVPDQDPEVVESFVRRHIAAVAAAHTAGVRFHVRTIARGRPVEVDPRHPAMGAAVAAYRSAFGRAPALLRSGGSIPAVLALRECLGLETVLMGFALPDDGMHGPNERFHLPTYFRAMEASVHFLHEWARRGPRRGRVAPARAFATQVAG